MHVGTTRHVCSNSMMDKLECPIELQRPLKRAALEIVKDVRSVNPSIKFKKSPYYGAVVDLREVTGEPALFHINSRFGNHAHKLEVLESGSRSWDANMGVIESVYGGDPRELPVRRVDLCADTDVNMGFVARSVRAACKRLEWQFGEVTASSEGKKIDFMEVTGRELETLQFGCRPNVFRVYNKVRERDSVYTSKRRRMERQAAELLAVTVMDNANIPRNDKEMNRGFAKRLKPSAVRMKMFEMPSFYDFCGYYEWQTVTRVERQISGNVPLVLSSVGAMRDNLLSWNPFERLNFSTQFSHRDFELDTTIRCYVDKRNGSYKLVKVNADGEESFYRKYSSNEWWAGIKYWELIDSGEMTFNQLTKTFGKNRGKIIEKLEPFFYQAARHADGERSQVLSADDLFETYRESMKRQLAA